MKKIGFKFLCAFVLSVTGSLCFGFNVKSLETSRNEAIAAANQLEGRSGSSVAEKINRITQELYNRLNQVNDYNKQKKNELAALKNSSSSSSANSGGTTIRGLWKKMNKPHGWSDQQYQNASPDEIKAAWREFHRKREEERLMNSR